MAVCNGKFWSAAETEYGSEGIARRSIQALGLEVYLPMFRARASNGVRRIRPLFDGYVLVRLEPSKGWGDLGRCKGVRKLMRRAGNPEDALPAMVRDENIEYVRSLEDEHGYVRLEDQEPPAFSLREYVKPTRGAFADQTGQYLRIDATNARRAIVAFRVLGREVASSIVRYDLVRA